MIRTAIVLIILVVAVCIALSFTDEKPRVKGDFLPKNVALQTLSDEHISMNDISKPYVLVVFASWCTTCAAEQPLLIDLAKKDIDLYGLGWKDSKENLETWLEKNGNPFKEVFLDESGKHSHFLNISGTPETFVINKGEILYKHVGMLDNTTIDYQLIPLIRALY